MYKNTVSLAIGVALAFLFNAVQPQLANARGIGLSGEVNPEYKGHAFKSFAISAVNAERDFQHWYERLMYDLFKKHFRDNLKAIELHKYIGTTGFDPNVKTVSATELLEDLKKQKIEVLILFNVFANGGDNLNEIRTLQDALNATVSHRHDPSSIRLYSYSRVTLYDVATGKIIWRGQGPLRAKVGARKHLKKNAIIQTKYLYKYLLKSDLLPPSFTDKFWKEDDDI